MTVPQLAIPTDALGVALAIVAVLLAAVVRRVMYWSDQWRGYAERLARAEQRLDDLARQLERRPP